jgi:hypothetical protein
VLDQFKKLIGGFDRGAQLPYIPLKDINHRTWLFKELVAMLAEEQDEQKEKLLGGLLRDLKFYVKSA